MSQNKAEETPPSLGQVINCLRISVVTNSYPVKLPVAKTAGHQVSQLCTIPGKAVLAMGSSQPGVHGLSPSRAPGLL